MFLEELEPDCNILKVFERFPKIWKVPDIFGKFWAVVMVLGLERLEDFWRFLAGFRDCNNFWKVAI